MYTYVTKKLKIKYIELSFFLFTLKALQRKIVKNLLRFTFEAKKKVISLNKSKTSFVEKAIKVFE